MILTPTDPIHREDSTLSGFYHSYETVNGVRLHYVAGGNTSGPTVLLLAGFPESWYAWRKIMPMLGEKYHLIAPDMPGQGDSDHPNDGYDTRTLAATVHGLLSQLGIERYHLVAHDIGAWVAYPYAACFGDELEKLVLLDAGIPGITLPNTLPITPDKAFKTWHFAFHVIADLPEFLISGKERGYLEWFLRSKAANPETFGESDIDEYTRVFTRKGGLRAGLAYYRSVAASTEQNREFSRQGKLQMPLLALGADQGSIPDMAGPLREFAENVTGGVISHCGHFQPEEQPQAVVSALFDFLG